MHLSTAQRNLQDLGCWNHLEKLAEMFLNTFHREHILLILKIKKLLRKIRSKNLTAGGFYSALSPTGLTIDTLRDVSYNARWFWTTICYGPMTTAYLCWTTGNGFKMTD